MVEIIMNKPQGKYGYVGINIPKEVKIDAKEFCKKHGLVFSKFVESALQDRIKKVQQMYDEFDI